jgi:hypothetical protein
MGEFGLAFIKLAKFETEKAMSDAQGSHAADTKRLGTVVIKASRFYRDANIKSAKHMVSTFSCEEIIVIQMLQIKVIHITFYEK